MALQADVALATTSVVRRDGVIRDRLTIERHLYGGAGGLDFKRIPLTGRFGCDLRGWRQGIDGARLVCRTEILPGVGVKSHVLDLYLVASVRRQLPIVCRIARIKR